MSTVVRIVVVLAAIISCGLAIVFNQNAVTAQNELDGERYKRIVAEESLSKVRAELTAVQSNASRMEKKLANTETLLQQTKEMNDDLKVRMDKAENIRKDLEQRINELLSAVGGSS